MKSGSRKCEELDGSSGRALEREMRMPGSVVVMTSHIWVFDGGTVNRRVRSEVLGGDGVHCG